eukprot:CAMPEP_0172178194 /NCGR_PEP_ID=MMETSP1050-20130122/15885_1 /TAXON_ID=233186 /ORGANISM="Cryptomonas curvata, Strain CCAP979/52" /LENGTH=66 /DNA_ID=CAMNT_0012850855 /DNA_START=180 /DNA_END=380 /DNA_ORIENTATION=-
MKEECAAGARPSRSKSDCAARARPQAHLDEDGRIDATKNELVAITSAAAAAAEAAASASRIPSSTP